MANISDHLSRILSARYGEEVRESIHDSIKAINDAQEDVGVDELLDARIGFDGFEYSTAGEAIRNQTELAINSQKYYDYASDLESVNRIGSGGYLFQNPLKTGWLFGIRVKITAGSEVYFGIYSKTETNYIRRFVTNSIKNSTTTDQVIFIPINFNIDNDSYYLYIYSSGIYYSILSGKEISKSPAANVGKTAASSYNLDLNFSNKFNWYISLEYSPNEPRYTHPVMYFKKENANKYIFIDLDNKTIYNKEFRIQLPNRQPNIISNTSEFNVNAGFDSNYQKCTNVYVSLKTLTLYLDFFSRDINDPIIATIGNNGEILYGKDWTVPVNYSKYKKYVFLGDSYLEGYSPDGSGNGWGYYLASYLNLKQEDYLILYEGGSGFANRGQKGHTYKTLFESSGIKWFDYLIICGGYNDNSHSQSDIYSSMVEFLNDLSNNKIGNKDSSIYVGVVGYNSKDEEIEKNIFNKVIPVYIGAIRFNNLYNIRYINNIEYTLGSTLMASDGYHPNNLGQHYLAEAIIQGIKTGSAPFRETVKIDRV